MPVQPRFLCETPYLDGLRVFLNPHMLIKRWVFPKERFFEWEPKDEDVCRRLGIGHEVVEPDPTMYRMGNAIYMHPDIWLKLQEYLKEQGRRNEELLYGAIMSDLGGSATKFTY